MGAVMVESFSACVCSAHTSEGAVSFGSTATGASARHDPDILGRNGVDASDPRPGPPGHFANVLSASAPDVVQLAGMLHAVDEHLDVRTRGFGVGLQVGHQVLGMRESLTTRYVDEDPLRSIAVS